MYTPTQAIAETPYAKTAGEEPLPGYRLLEPLGRGGFGEVWKCEAPGGLHKAVKFVSQDPDMTNSSGNFALVQEFEAFQQIKLIRHPFLLMLERVELVGNELVMVMELADNQLQDRFAECRARGLPGIPRRELLGYYVDAAEALDLIGRKHGLQHLDIKPANLFIVGGHVKVGDYGLLVRMETNPGVANPAHSNRGLTPRYVAPEVLRGSVHPQSDQYSLALVYQELLTGTFPYSGKTPQQMMLQHVQAIPDLSGLPETDRPTIGRALAKNPADRYPSCLAFVQALIVGPDQPPPAPAGYTSSAATSSHSAMHDSTVSSSQYTGRHPAPPSPVVGLPALTTVGVPRAIPHSAPIAPRPRAASDEPDEVALMVAAADSGEIKLKPIESVVGTPRLLGEDGPPALLMADQFIEAMLSACAAAASGYVATMPGEISVLPDGSWGTRFPTTLLPSVVPLKLGTLVDDGWCDEVTHMDKTKFVLRVKAPGGGLFGRKKNGAEVTVTMPQTRAGASSMARMSTGSNNGRQSTLGLNASAQAARDAAGVCEVDVHGTIFGSPDASFQRIAMEALPNLIGEVRRLLMNADDRRKAQRIPVSTSVVLYPIHENGVVLPPVAAQVKDVSAGGLCVAAKAAIPTRYMYVEFDQIGLIAGCAILVRLTRSHFTGFEQVLAGRFRTDI